MTVDDDVSKKGKEHRKIEIALLSRALLRPVFHTTNTNIYMTRRSENTRVLCLFGGDKRSAAIHKSVRLSIAPETSRKSDLWPEKYFRDPIRGSSHVFPIRIRSVRQTAIREKKKKKKLGSKICFSCKL